MSKQVMSGTPEQPPRHDRESIGVWWQRTGEPVVLTGLVLVVCTIPLLVLLELLSRPTGVRTMLGLIWLMGGILLTRLPRLLCHEHRRIAVIGIVGCIALAFTLFANPSTAQQAAPADRSQSAPLAAGLAQSTSPLTFKSPPRISRELFAQLLQRGTGGAGTSPAAPYAGELYDIIVGYELDPAVALAFFAQESQFCTTGICRKHDMKSWGGQRAAFKRERAANIIMGQSGPFVSYHTWQDGVSDWCELILYRYVARGLDTIDKAVPVYAPAADNNDPSAYINSVTRRVAVWQGRDPGVPVPIAARTYDDDLETALLKETFLSTGLDYHPNWAFHKYVLDESRAGRPLGSPIDESRYIRVGSRLYAVQTFALDTLYTPLADVESQTNWSDVRRLSELLQQQQQQQQQPPPQPPPPDEAQE